MRGIIFAIFVFFIFSAFFSRLFSPIYGTTELDNQIQNLIPYSIFSLLRVWIAYFLSLFFGIFLGYISFQNKTLGGFIMPLVDVLQSIPVLGFLPGVLLLLSQIPILGKELASIVLISTGMIWNIIIGFYSSLLSIPEEYRDMAKSYKIPRINFLILYEIPYSKSTLIANSIMSFSGGWYFLMYCEMFEVGNMDFKLPGLGSFLLISAERGDILKVFLGIFFQILIIVLTFFFVWYPLQKRKDFPFIGKFDFKFPSTFQRISRIFSLILLFSLFFGLFFLLINSFGFILSLPFDRVPHILLSIFLSFLRIVLAIFVSSIIAMPLGIFLGLSRWGNRALLVAQILASIPATSLFPVILYIIPYKFLSSLIVVILSSIWYIFFNTIGGCLQIKKEYKEVSTAFKIRGWRFLVNVVIPYSYPEIYTGLITAWGGAWNGTIVAEYMKFGEEEIHMDGVGYLIVRSASGGDGGLLFLTISLLSIFLVFMNKTFWSYLRNMIKKR